MTKRKTLRVPEAALLATLAPAAAIAASVTPLHTFTASDGFPVGSLVAFNGLLYGASEEGPINNSGTIFSIDPKTGTEHDLYTFALPANNSPKDGYEPVSGLTRLGTRFYGATVNGHGNQTENGNYFGYGTVFAFDPATNKETPLHDFNGTDGAQPSLMHDPLVAYQGALYGTTFFNGPNDRGEIYKITPAGKFTVAYDFPTVANGCSPTGILITDGTLYATTAGCGANGGGNLFSLALATGVQTIIHSFDSAEVPLGQPLIYNGALYGITQSSGADHAGSAYKVDLASGAYTLLYTFTASGNDGDQPSGSLTLFRGTIYGETSYGPGQGIMGTIFTINPSTGALAIVASFTEDTGYAPFGPLLAYGGALYGTTVDYLLESSARQGSVFRFKP